MGFVLNIDYLHDDCDVYACSAAVQSNGFAGWIENTELGKRQLQDFARSIRGFPLPQAEPVCLRTQTVWTDGRTEERLRIEIRPYNRTGTLHVRIGLSGNRDQLHEQAPGPRHSVSTSFLTDYAMLDRFADAIDRILAQDSGEALLEEQK